MRSRKSKATSLALRARTSGGAKRIMAITLSRRERVYQFSITWLFDPSLAALCSTLSIKDC